MALTELQRTVCRLLAKRRIESGESYIAGAAALNEFTVSPRVSRDLDLFHDTEEALHSSWEADRKLLEALKFNLTVLRERPGFVEVEASAAAGVVKLEYTRDSAFRFFPLQQHPDFGLVLHSFDLATNKVLALVGRLEIRDWIDVIGADQHIQPLGYLAWAACAKDPGFSPGSILEGAARSNRHAQPELDQLTFAGPKPDLSELSARWHQMLQIARDVVPLLPAQRAGTCVLDRNAGLFTGSPQVLKTVIAEDALMFHEGSIGGAMPRIITEE